MADNSEDETELTAEEYSDEPEPAVTDESEPVKIEETASERDDDVTDGGTTSGDTGEGKIAQPPAPKRNSGSPQSQLKGMKRDSGGVRRDSTMSDIPLTDSAVLKELQKAEEQARYTATLIQQMKDSIESFQKRPLTESDARKLGEKQSLLMKKLAEFEDITRRVQRLIGLADISSAQFEPSYSKIIEEEKPKEKEPIAADHGLSKGGGVSPQEMGLKYERTMKAFCHEEVNVGPCYSEEMLPKIIICNAEGQVPGIIVCELPKRRFNSPQKLHPEQKPNKDIDACCCGAKTKSSV